ncbi:MAG: hypothetical protein PHG04_00895 [Candidatus Nanoarchaeia archaeon]|nr:hypothetical protein [Candidatus Nanoarchaeia archaeon]
MNINKTDEFWSLLSVIINMFLISMIPLNAQIMGMIILIANIIFIVVIFFDLNTKTESEKKVLGVFPFLPPVFFIILGLVCSWGFLLTFVQIINIINISIFFILVGIVFLIVVKSIMLIFNAETYYQHINETGNIKEKAEYNPLPSEEKKNYKLSNLAFGMLIYKVLRTIALSAFIFSNLWILSISPFSFFGGSLYGGIMQVILASALGLLLISFWVNGNNLGLILVTGGCFAVYMLSFMFPTLFANLWIFSTTGSASAGASAVSGFGSISPISYYKSTYSVRTGVTEKRIGPTYELISDEVVSTSFSVLGRLCDDSVIVASVTVQNLAKFELKDLLIQLSAIRDPYFKTNICNVEFTESEGGLTHTEYISNLPKGVPRTVNIPFTTRLPADVMNQICKIRSNVLVHYHTTSVFPLSFIDYNTYLINPKNIGNPVSTSSFGRVLLSMDVGQQPVVVRDETKEDNSILLKLAWSQKESGVVNNPKIILYLPEDLGVCRNLSSTLQDILTAGSGGYYTGVYGYNRDRTQLFQTTDFICTNYLQERGSYDDITDYCNSVFLLGENITTGIGETLLYSGWIDPSHDSSFNDMPSFFDACEDLALKGYSVCVANKNIVQDSTLLCSLSFEDLSIADIDLTTYLIRADALYSFNNIREETFSVENCNAI